MDTKIRKVGNYEIRNTLLWLNGFHGEVLLDGNWTKFQSAFNKVWRIDENKNQQSDLPQDFVNTLLQRIT